MPGILDIIIIACSLYLLNAASRIKTTGEISQMLLGKGMDTRRCKDLEGYKKFIFPRILTLGIATLIYGLLGLFKAYSEIIMIAYFVWLFVMLFVIFWYLHQAKKGVRKYWGIQV